MKANRNVKKNEELEEHSKSTGVYQAAEAAKKIVGILVTGEIVRKHTKQMLLLLNVLLL